MNDSNSALGAILMIAGIGVLFGVYWAISSLIDAIFSAAHNIFERHTRNQ